MADEPKPVNEDHLKQLKERMNLIASADPAQYHNEYSLRRYLRAFKTVDNAFQVLRKVLLLFALKVYTPIITTLMVLSVGLVVVLSVKQN